TEREPRLVVLPYANWMRELWQPRLQTFEDRLFERPKIRQHLARLGVVPLGEFDNELEQPRHSIRPLETGASFTAQIRRFLFQIFHRQTLAERLRAAAGERRLRQLFYSQNEAPA